MDIFSNSSAPTPPSPESKPPLPTHQTEPPAQTPVFGGQTSPAGMFEEQQDTTVQAVMDSANQHYNEALTLAHNGKLDEAIVQLQAAISLAGNQPNFYNLLGTCYAQKGLYSEAIETWKRTLTLDAELERAYKNIEKARHLEGEAVAESGKRPLLTAITGLCVAIAFLVCISGFLGVKIWRMSSSIRSLNSQIEIVKQEKDAAEKQASGRIEMTHYKDLEQQMQVLRGQLAEKDEEIRRKEAEYLELQQRNARQLADLETSIESKDQQIRSLNGELGEVVVMSKTIAELQGEIEVNGDKLIEKENSIAALNKTRETLENQIQQLSRELDESRREWNQKELALRQEKEDALSKQSNQLQEATGRLKALIDLEKSRQMATNLTRQALIEMDAHRFDESLKYLTEALRYDQQNVIALDYKNRIQEILSDPFERELIIASAKVMEDQKEQKLQEIRSNLRSEAEHAYEEGNYSRAAEYFGRLHMLTKDEGERSKIATILVKSEESAKRLQLQVDEATREMNAGNPERAREILKEVLKESPQNQRAVDLQSQLNS